MREQGWAGSPALQIRALSSEQSPNPALIPQRTHVVQSKEERAPGPALLRQLPWGAESAGGQEGGPSSHLGSSSR